MGDMRWHGWGEDSAAVEVPPHALAFLSEEVGLAAAPRRPPPLETLHLPGVALPPSAREALAAIVGAAHVRDDREARVRHAAGRSYPDLVRLRSGTLDAAPDAVVWPGGHDEVLAVLGLCADEGVAVVPFGGGTSVVGGVDPVRGPLAAVVALDLSRMDALVAVDERSLIATVQAGLRAPAAERLLGARGLTLGHVPQSFEYVSLGGCVATRSAGQASTGFGRIDELVSGLTLAAPAGEIGLPARPPSAAGPQLRELLVGSEGALGVITRVDLRVRPVAPFRYEGWFAASFHEGVEAAATARAGGLRAGGRPAVRRGGDAPGAGPGRRGRHRRSARAASARAALPARPRALGRVPDRRRVGGTGRPDGAVEGTGGHHPARPRRGRHGPGAGPRVGGRALSRALPA